MKIQRIVLIGCWLLTMLAMPSAPVRAASTLELYGTFQAMGIIVNLTAGEDPNQNATAAVAYRVTGSGAYRQGLPLARVSTTRFVGSLFWLSPGTAYDVRVTFTDPDGAPLNGTVDLNLGVPGYRYDVAFGADRVPVAPLVNTFMPDRKGQMGGTLTANAQIKGAGITGAGLQKNLTGQFAGGVTNLNLSVMDVHSAILKTLINVIATIPELLGSPEKAIGSLAGQVTGQGGGLMDELKKSPIQVINAQGRANGGRIDLQQATVHSPAFKADARGDIALAGVLTNSIINIPVAVFVSRSIGTQLNLASANTAANAPYVALPQFLTMSGTIGNPKADINKVALAGLAVKSVGQSLLGQPQNGGSKAGNLLNNLLKKVK